MANSSEQLQDIILRAFGMQDSVQAREDVKAFWDLHVQKGAISQELRFLYTRLSVVEYLLDGNYKKFNWENNGVRQDDSDKVKNLNIIRKAIEDRIALIEGRQSINAGFAVGDLIYKTPIVPDPTTLDPNDRTYRGDVQRRWSRVPENPIDNLD